MWNAWHALQRPGVRFYLVNGYVYAAHSRRQLAGWWRFSGPKIDLQHAIQVHWSQPFALALRKGAQPRQIDLRAWHRANGARIPESLGPCLPY